MLLELIECRKNYSRGNKSFAAVDNVSLKMGKGDFVCMIGRSGSGKTTLLNMITGLVRPDSGTIRLNDQDITLFDDEALSGLRNSVLGYIPQRCSLLSNFSVIENICLPHFLADRQKDNVFDRAYSLLEQIGLSHLSHSYPGELSGGEMRRIAIIRSLINSPSILIADEPTSDLDVASVREVLDLLLHIHKQGVAVLLVTHELDIVRYSQRLTVMQSGKLIELEEDKASREMLAALLAKQV